ADTADDAPVGMPGQPDQTFNTVVAGNSADVTYLPPSNGSSCGTQAQFDVVYTDSANFFSGDPSIDVWISITAVNGGTSKSAMKGFVTLTNVPGGYLNQICVDNADSFLVAIAFTDTAHDKWDS